MIDLILAQNHAWYTALQKIKDDQNKAEVQRLKSRIVALESQVEYFQQLLIFEQRKMQNYEVLYNETISYLSW